MIAALFALMAISPIQAEAYVTWDALAAVYDLPALVMVDESLLPPGAVGAFGGLDEYGRARVAFRSSRTDVSVASVIAHEAVHAMIAKRGEPYGGLEEEDLANAFAETAGGVAPEVSPMRDQPIRVTPAEAYREAFDAFMEREILEPCRSSDPLRQPPYLRPPYAEEAGALLHVRIKFLERLLETVLAIDNEKVRHCLLSTLWLADREATESADAVFERSVDRELEAAGDLLLEVARAEHLLAQLGDDGS